ncbi:MAG: MlaD family protein [Candidatus Azobacteroides sp.]|nr:MlaD family protein [Candidatus Azobacteroides sp.]
MKKYFSRESIIGIIAVISLVVLFFGINYLKGVNLFKPTNHYYVRFENVTDLQNTSPVYVDGFKIGVVTNISYDYTRIGNILVQISLDKNMRIQTGSFVELSSSLTAGASLSIMLNKQVTSQYQIGDTIEGILKTGPMEMLTKTLVPKIDDIMPKIDSIVTGLQKIVNHPALLQSLNSIQNTTANLQKTTASLNQMMSGDIPVILGNFKTISSDLTEVSSELKSLDLTSAYNSLNVSLNNFEKLSNRFESKDNNIGLLFNDRTLYDNLNTTTENASNLLLDLKQNPKRYVHFSVF